MGLHARNLAITDRRARSGHILPIHFVSEVLDIDFSRQLHYATF